MSENIDNNVTIHSEENELVMVKEEVSAVVNTIEHIYKLLKQGFENYELDENNMVDFVIRAMTLVEQEKTLNGREKKAVVIEILSRLVDSYTSKLNTESRISLKLIIKTIVPGMIDGIIQASKGFVSVNKTITEKTKKFCSCC
jgi:hypothetical protein